MMARSSLLSGENQMSVNFVTPMELYHAAREVCLRLYVLNGGDARATWTVKPFPGTAAIVCKFPAYGPPEFTLGMPAFPIGARLARWKSDLIGAYTTHELLHALWTDWDAVKQSHVEGLHSLTNALEDNRIEARASRGDLLQVSGARRLLMALNAHIARRAMGTPGFTLDAPEQFSFVLGLVIFAEKLGYISELPANWRALVNPAWFPLFDLALARFDSLLSTWDTLQLARDLKALAASLPKTPRKPKPQPQPQLPQPQPQPKDTSEDADEDEGGSMPSDREIVEDEDEPQQGEPQQSAQGEQEPQPAPQAPQKPAEPQIEDKPHDDGADAGKPQENAPKPSTADKPQDKASEDEAQEDDAASKLDGEGSQQGGRGSDGAMPQDEPAEDVTDKTQTYDEAHLNDISQQTAKDMHVNNIALCRDARDMETILGAAPLNDVPEGYKHGANPKLVGAMIASPAKLRRHLTLAVKSPERIGNERKQVSGRLDLRNLTGLAMGSPTVFRRRVEDEGKEAAVSLLIDISGSMKGERLNAAKALALHMGDALKAAGVKFEIAGFDDYYMPTPKPFAKGWNNDTRRAVAGMHTLNGTSMLPAMKQAAERLVRVGNVTRRILLVLTDGQDSYAETANAALCAFYRGRGVEIVGIGLLTGDMRATFAGNAIRVDNHRLLSTQGLTALVKTLDKGAPRSA
jgi:hypothetical protein